MSRSQQINRVNALLWIIDRDLFRPNSMVCLGGMHYIRVVCGGAFVLGRRSNNRNNQNTNDREEARVSAHRAPNHRSVAYRSKQSHLFTRDLLPTNHASVA